MDAWCCPGTWPSARVLVLRGRHLHTRSGARHRIFTGVWPLAPAPEAPIDRCLAQEDYGDLEFSTLRWSQAWPSLRPMMPTRSGHRAEPQQIDRFLEDEDAEQDRAQRADSVRPHKQCRAAAASAQSPAKPGSPALIPR